MNPTDGELIRLSTIIEILNSHTLLQITWEALRASSRRLLWSHRQIQMSSIIAAADEDGATILTKFS